MKVSVGLDIGTTSISCVAIAESGQQLVTVNIAHNAALTNLPTGHVEQDPAALWDIARECLNQCCTQLNDHISGIGVTGQMHSTVLLDRSGHPVYPVITWQDQRAALGEPSHMEELLEALPVEHMEGTGCRLSPGFMGTNLYSLSRTSSLPEQLNRVSFVADWIVSRLTGTVSVTDRTHAASSGLYDLRSDGWNECLLEQTRTDRDWLPQVRPSGEIAGVIFDEFLPAHHRGPSIPVCTAIGDHQAAVLSTLSDEGTGSLLINIGTGGQVCWRTTEFLPQNGLEIRPLPADSLSEPCDFIYVGAGLCGGSEFAWVAKTFQRLAEEMGVPVSHEQIWQQLTRYTELADTGLNCEPYFFGTRPEPHRRGFLSQIDGSNLTVHSLASAVARGIAQSMHHLSTSGGARPGHVLMSGNALRSIPLLRCAIRELYGVPVHVVGIEEAAATGAALLAGVATGMWANISEARCSMNSTGPRGHEDD